MDINCVLLYLACRMAMYCDKQSASKHERPCTEALGAVKGVPRKGQRTVPTLHRLRCGSKRSPPSLSLDPREERHGFQASQARNFGPFHAVFRGFLDVSAIPTVSDYGRQFVGSVVCRLAPLGCGTARSIDSGCCDCGCPEQRVGNTRDVHIQICCIPSSPLVG
jgi:hypothetical protein